MEPAAVLSARIRALVQGAAARVLQAARREGQPLEEPPELGLVVPREADFGHLASNLALVWARRTGLPARALAERLRAELVGDRLLAEVRVEGPGFLNLELSAEGVASLLVEALRPGSAPPPGPGSIGLSWSCPAEPGPALTAARAREAALGLGRWWSGVGCAVEVRGPVPRPGPARVRLERGGEVTELPVGPARWLGGRAPGRSVSAPARAFHLLSGPLGEERILSASRLSDPTSENPWVSLRLACARASMALKMGADQRPGLSLEPQAWELAALQRPLARGLLLALEEGSQRALRAGPAGDLQALLGAASRLARRFHRLYVQEDLLGGSPGAVAARLALVRAVSGSLRAALALVGAEAPRRMEVERWRG